MTRDLKSATEGRQCFHRENGRQVPCPPMCPYQSWPRSEFRFTWITGRWKRKARQ